jgi:hypothetical protein
MYIYYFSIFRRKGGINVRRRGEKGVRERERKKK